MSKWSVRKIGVLSAAVLLTGVLAGCGGSSTDAEKGEPRSAEVLYKQLCINCHGTDLQGKSAPALKGLGDSKTAEQLAAKIEKGGGGMPSFGKMLKPEEVQGLAEWLIAQK